MRRRCDGALTGHAGAFRPSQQRLPPSPSSDRSSDTVSDDRNVRCTGNRPWRLRFRRHGSAQIRPPPSLAQHHRRPTRPMRPICSTACARTETAAHTPAPCAPSPLRCGQPPSSRIHAEAGRAGAPASAWQPKSMPPTKRRPPATVEDEAGSAGSETPVATRKC